jgi:hypothetical protein
MGSSLIVSASFGAAFMGFLLWYGGRGKPLTENEIARYMAALAGSSAGEHDAAATAQIRRLVANDDGHEFVMQNLVRYRARALYPPGHDVYGDDPRAADQRYAKAIIWPLFRYGNLPIFIARRTGNFIEFEGDGSWHYVAMVRYRSRRDFLRFALMSSQRNSFIHKWAAIDKTHVFPVKPVISLVMVRASVGVLMALCAGAVMQILR